MGAYLYDFHKEGFRKFLSILWMDFAKVELYDFYIIDNVIFSLYCYCLEHDTSSLRTDVTSHESMVMAIVTRHATMVMKRTVSSY